MLVCGCKVCEKGVIRLMPQATGIVRHNVDIAREMIVLGNIAVAPLV